MDKLCYQIDQHDRIIATTGPWDQFARANSNHFEPQRLSSAEVAGHTIFQFVQDDATRMLLRSIISMARLLGKPRQVDYRCDSEREKRYMRMHISPLQDGSIELCHQTLELETLSPPFVTQTVSRGIPHFCRCSLCNRIEKDDAWLEPDDELLQQLPQPCPVYHSICPLCHHRIDQIINTNP